MWRRQSSPTVAVAEKSVETPHVFLDKVVDMPVVCNNRCLVSGSAVQFIDSYECPCGCAPDSVHRGYGGHSSSQQRQVLDLPAGCPGRALDDEELVLRRRGLQEVPESPGV